jgi:transcription elongation factor Elf1
MASGIEMCCSKCGNYDPWVPFRCLSISCNFSLCQGCADGTNGIVPVDRAVNVCPSCKSNASWRKQFPVQGIEEEAAVANTAQPFEVLSAQVVKLERGALSTRGGIGASSCRVAKHKAPEKVCRGAHYNSNVAMVYAKQEENAGVAEGLPVRPLVPTVDQGKSVLLRPQTLARKRKRGGNQFMEAERTGLETEEKELRKRKYDVPTVQGGAVKAKTKKQRGKADMQKVVEQARTFATDIVQSLALKLNCPRCKMATYSSDKSSVLVCPGVKCQAILCGICSKECKDEEQGQRHVIDAHGDCSSAALVEEARYTQNIKMAKQALQDLPSRPTELKMLAHSIVEHAILPLCETGNDDIIKNFVASARESLRRALHNDRLSILRDPQAEDNFKSGLRFATIIPKYRIPHNYALSLLPIAGYKNTFKMLLESEEPPGSWKSVNITTLDKDMERGIHPWMDIFVMLKRSLSCAVIAVQERNELLQTIEVPQQDDFRLGRNDICVKLKEIRKEGGLEGKSKKIENRLKLVGFSSNYRLMMLAQYVKERNDRELVSVPAGHYIGAGRVRPVVFDFLGAVPPSHHSLNQQQVQIAHPLLLKSAMEVAGPPGTGKTKTVVELSRALMDCTRHDVVVISERNGAIDAIAEKFAEHCIEFNDDGDALIFNEETWLNVLTFGAGNAMGASTKLFTLVEKLR